MWQAGRAELTTRGAGAAVEYEFVLLFVVMNAQSAVMRLVSFFLLDPEYGKKQHQTSCKFRAGGPVTRDLRPQLTNLYFYCSFVFDVYHGATLQWSASPAIESLSVHMLFYSLSPPPPTWGPQTLADELSSTFPGLSLAECFPSSNTLSVPLILLSIYCLHPVSRCQRTGTPIFCPTVLRSHHSAPGLPTPPRRLSPRIPLPQLPNRPSSLNPVPLPFYPSDAPSPPHLLSKAATFPLPSTRTTHPPNAAVGAKDP